MTEKTFAEKLKAARHATGLTRAELAERTQIPKTLLNAWETGRMEPMEYVQRQTLEQIESIEPVGGLNGLSAAERIEILKELEALQNECKALKMKVLGLNARTSKRGPETRYYEGFGLSLPCEAWAKLSGLSVTTLRRDLNAGQSIEGIYAVRDIPAPTTE